MIKLKKIWSMADFPELMEVSDSFYLPLNEEMGISREVQEETWEFSKELEKLFRQKLKENDFAKNKIYDTTDEYETELFGEKYNINYKMVNL